MTTPTYLLSGDNQGQASFVGGNDGTVVVQTGAFGAKVNALTLDASGNATVAGNETVGGNLTVTGKIAQTTPASMVRVGTANGYGSTNNKIMRFSNTLASQGTDITYADSAANGATFTINTNGTYGVWFECALSASAYLGVSLNSNQLTTAIYGITRANCLSANSTVAASVTGSCGGTFYFSAGDVVRVHTDGTATGGNAYTQNFTITRVS